MSHSPLRLLLKYRNLNHRLSAVVGNKDITRTIFAYAKGRRIYILRTFIPVIFQVASLLAALTHPGHIVCRRDAS
ncbi:hypothetical protein C5472_10985 [Photorhabdus sp. RW14-46]|nr:hypothetical protein [Photorhabdus sp. RW14-46]